MIGTTARCLMKALGRSQATEEEFATTLVSIEAALNSSPITQDTEDTLTPVYFICGAKVTTLPFTTEPQMKGNLKKKHQTTKRMADDFWKRWEEEYLMELKFLDVISQPKGKSGKVRTRDIVFLQEEHCPRHMWKKARV